MTRILMASHGVPNDGHRVRLANLATSMSQFAEVRVLAAVPAKPRPARGDAPYEVDVVRLCRASQVLRAGAALASGQSMRRAFLASAKMRNAMSDAVRKFEPDLVLLKRKRMGQYVDQVPEHIPVILDFTDSVALLQSRVAASGAPLRLRLKNNLDLPGTIREELRLVRSNRFAEYWFSSGTDIAFVEMLLGHPLDRAVVLPNVVDAAFFELQRRPIDSRVIFFGDFRVPTNASSLFWFCDEVVPYLRRLHPSLEVQFIGHNTEQVRRKAREAGCAAEGWVVDIGSELSTSAVCVAPMNAGAGVKNKVLQSLAAGVPTVATSIAVEGIDISGLPNGVLSIEDEPVAFAESVADRLASGEDSSSHALGSRIIKDRYSLDSLARLTEARVTHLTRASAGGSQR